MSRDVALDSVLFVSHDAGRTGAPIVFLHLLRWLRTQTTQPLNVLIRQPGELVAEFEKIADTVVLAPQPKSAPARALRKIERQVSPGRSVLPSRWRKRRWSLIYSNTVTNGSLVQAIAPPGAAVVTHVHELRYWIERAGADNWQRVKSHTSRFLAASAAVKETLADVYAIAPDLIEVVHEFVSDVSGTPVAADLRTALAIPADAFVVGGSGHEMWRKGKDLFVQLAASVRRRAPSQEIHFVWVGNPGSGDDRYHLEHDAQQAGISDRVHWTGEVPNPHAYFSLFDVFAMVSREDPFPLVCLEAALLEKPILCFANSGGVPELVEADAGYVVPYLDVEAMAGHILDLADEPRLRLDIGRRARRKVLERHTVERAGAAILDIIARELHRVRLA